MAKVQKIGVTITGLKELKVKLRQGGAELYGPPMTDALEQVGVLAQGAVEAAAPVRSGRLKGSITHKVSAAKPFPSSVAIRATAMSAPSPGGKRRNKRTHQLGRPWPKGYAYGKRLEYDPTRHHLHWMADAIEAGQPSYEQALNIAAKQIELAWSLGFGNAE